MKNTIKAVVLIFLFASCELTEEEKKSLLPDSSGDLAELVVIGSSTLLDTTTKEAIGDLLSHPIPGQPPPGEPAFKLLFTTEIFFEGYFKKHHNIVVLLDTTSSARLQKVLPKVWVDKMVAFFRENPTTLGVKQKNIFAQNQNIFVILADSKSAMLAKMVKKKEDIQAIVLENENKTGRKRLLGEVRAKQDKFYQKCIAERGFGIRKPQTYRVAIDKEDFVWLRKSSTVEEQELGLLLFEAPYTATEDLSTDSLLAIRNRFTKKYIPGEVKGSFMAYSDVLKPVRTDQNFKGKYGVQIRGWWDVTGDFMGGPSYIRAVVDEANGRIVFAEGFLFYPNEKKGKIMRELEILVNTLSIK